MEENKTELFNDILQETGEKCVARNIKVSMIITLSMAFISFVLWILIPSVRFIIFSVLFLCSGFFHYLVDKENIKMGKKVSNKKIVERYVGLGIVVFIITSTHWVFIDMTSSFNYPIVKAFIESQRSNYEPDWFPEDFGEIVSDFRFVSAPNWMDPGTYEVSYVTTTENASRLAEEMKGKASSFHYLEDGIKSLHYYIQSTLFKGDTGEYLYDASGEIYFSGITVYEFKKVGYGNESYIDGFALIDTSTGKVMFANNILKYN